MEPTPARRPGPPPPPPQTGTLIAERYRLTGFLGRSAYGEILRAEDTREHGPVAIRRLRAELVATPAARERLAAALERARTLEHPHIIKPLELLADGDHVYVVSQLVDGQTLRALIAARKGRFSVRDAAGVASQICSALAFAAPVTHHGALTPSNVLVEPSGQVRVAEIGVARALPLATADLDPADRPARPPEAASGEVDGRSDLFAVGAILFEMLTGRPYTAGLLPRNLRPELPPEIDALVGVLVEPAPADRFSEPETVRQRLGHIVADLEQRHDREREKQAQRASASHRAVTSESKVKRKKVKVDRHEHRWLVQHGGLDYGPYTLVELREKIEKDEVVPGDIVIDQELGTRAEAEAHPLLHDLVHFHAQKRDDLRRAHVETSAMAHEKRRGLALYGFIALAAGVLVVGVILALRLLQSGQRSGPRREAAVEAAALAGLKVGSARRLDDREAQRHARASRGSPRPAAPAASGDDAFNQALSFDSVAEEVGDERLSDEQIDAVLSKSSGALGRCLAGEAARGGARQADVDLIILGTGRVSQVRVNGETGSALAACVRGVLLGLRFPTFNGPRTKASFPMSL